MEIYQAVVLGILQGLAEFLPVSSSGHLVLFQNFFGITEPALAFDISLHMGTLAAVFVIFFNDIKAMVISIVRLFMNIRHEKNLRSVIEQDKDLMFAAMIIAGSVPTAVIGLVIQKYSNVFFSSVPLVGFMLIVTGSFLWSTKKFKDNNTGTKEIRLKQGLFIGLCQGIAVIPGISRSGSTITAGLFAGIDRETAARFSFLLSIPAILGAELLSLKDFIGTGISFDPATFYGTLTSFIVGLAALKILLKIVKTGRLYYFAPYCWLAGLIAIVAGLI